MNLISIYKANEISSPLQGFFTNFKIGGAPSNQMVVCWSAKVSWFSMLNALNDDITITAGTGTLAIIYFMEPSSPSWFITGGVGYSTWDTPFEEDSEAWTGTGLFAGGGYEFSKHWNIEAGLNWGNPSKSESGITATTYHTTLFFSINVMGY